MMRLVLGLIALMALVGCSTTDTTDIEDRLDDLATQVSSLSELADPTEAIVVTLSASTVTWTILGQLQRKSFGRDSECLAQARIGSPLPEVCRTESPN